jgi:MFS superfamily sulfate permease-like transporter
MKTQMEIPADGMKGLKQNWQKDLVSGFIVSLLALPLSLGIAKACEFPPIMGVLTAIIGGLVVGIISGAPLTIKGPAAGLITIVVGAVNGFGGGLEGWHMALGVIVVAAVFQIFFGVLKFGKFSDYFPHTVIHGMLGAIGFMILAKQLHILTGISPVHAEGPLKGKALSEPLDLFMALPQTIQTVIANPALQKISLVGMICLIVIFGWPMIKNKFIKKIPAPFVVLLISIPLGMALGLKDIKGGLVKVDNIFEVANFNVSFEGLTTKPGTFIYYVAMFALIGSIESLLTVKAIDIMDPFKRKSKANKDMIAQGIGNGISGVLGGLPMISEVARSTANVNNGARTLWSNVFHGLFLFIFVVAAIPIIELIPNTALAAMLIGVGYKLASIKEFIHILKIGWEQLIILVSTTVAILLTDLLIGVGIGIGVKFVIHYISGLPLKNTFKPEILIEDQDGRTVVHIRKAAVVTNFPGIAKKLATVPRNQKVLIDLSESYVIDHTSMENLNQFKKDYNEEGGQCEFYGLERHKALSKNINSTKILPKEVRREIKERLSGDETARRNRDSNHEHRIN